MHNHRARTEKKIVFFFIPKWLPWNLIVWLNLEPSINLSIARKFDCMITQIAPFLTFRMHTKRTGWENIVKCAGTTSSFAFICLTISSTKFLSTNVAAKKKSHLRASSFMLPLFGDNTQGKTSYLGGLWKGGQATREQKKKPLTLQVFLIVHSNSQKSDGVRCGSWQMKCHPGGPITKLVARSASTKCFQGITPKCKLKLEPAAFSFSLNSSRAEVNPFVSNATGRRPKVCGTSVHGMAEEGLPMRGQGSPRCDTREIHKVRFVPSSFQNRSAKLNKNKSASTLHHDLHTWNKHLNQMTI